MALTPDDIQLIKNALRPDFDRIDMQFEGMDKRFEGMDKRFNQVDQRFNQVDQRLGQLHELILEVHSDLIKFVGEEHEDYTKIHKNHEVRIMKLEKAADFISQ